VTGKTHTFNYHDLAEGDFLKQAMLFFVSGHRKDDGVFNDLSEATDHFKDVKLDITVSGIEMDAKGFMDRLDQAVDWAIERQVKETLTEKIPGFTELTGTIAELEAVIKERAVKIAADAGFELTDEEGRWRYR